MPEPIVKPELRPSFRLSREELAALIEAATGQKPKNGFQSLSVSQSADGQTGVITWLDAAGDTPEEKPKKAGKSDAKQPANS